MAFLLLLLLLLPFYDDSGWSCRSSLWPMLQAERSNRPSTISTTLQLNFHRNIGNKISFGPLTLFYQQLRIKFVRLIRFKYFYYIPNCWLTKHRVVGITRFSLIVFEWPLVFSLFFQGYKNYMERPRKEPQ